MEGYSLGILSNVCLVAFELFLNAADGDDDDDDEGGGIMTPVYQGA